LAVSTRISDLSQLRFAPKGSELKWTLSWGVPVKDLNIRFWKLEGCKMNAIMRAVSKYCNWI